jgi:hypothetical protein
MTNNTFRYEHAIIFDNPYDAKEAIPMLNIDGFDVLVLPWFDLDPDDGNPSLTWLLATCVCDDNSKERAKELWSLVRHTVGDANADAGILGGGFRSVSFLDQPDQIAETPREHELKRAAEIERSRAGIVTGEVYSTHGVKGESL